MTTQVDYVALYRKACERMADALEVLGVPDVANVELPVEEARKVLTQRLAEAREAGRREGLAQAAMKCEALAKLVGGSGNPYDPTSCAMYDGKADAYSDAAEEIRALSPEPMHSADEVRRAVESLEAAAAAIVDLHEWDQTGPAGAGLAGDGIEHVKRIAAAVGRALAVLRHFTREGEDKPAARPQEADGPGADEGKDRGSTITRSGGCLGELCGAPECRKAGRCQG